MEYLEAYSTRGAQVVNVTKVSVLIPDCCIARLDPSFWGLPSGMDTWNQSYDDVDLRSKRHASRQ